MNEILDWLKTFLLTIIGHAITGSATAFIYELGRLLSAGVTDWNVLVTGALIGASLAFFKVIVSEIEKVVIAPSPVMVAKGRKITELKPVKKSFKVYFGF